MIHTRGARKYRKSDTAVTLPTPQDSNVIMLNSYMKGLSLLRWSSAHLSSWHDESFAGRVAVFGVETLCGVHPIAAVAWIYATSRSECTSLRVAIPTLLCCRRLWQRSERGRA